MLTTGNTAKLYCLNWIERLIEERTRPLRILDLGCGRALNFVELLRRHPETGYVGVEPDRDECRRAEANVRELGGEVINSTAYRIADRLTEPFDVVASFSVLEHVYRRAPYLAAVKSCLAKDGYAFVNYDAGHFILPNLQDRLKRTFGGLLARLGYERHYQRFVAEHEFVELVGRVGLHIVESRSFNTHLKGLYRLVPAERRPEFMERWLELELWLNAVSPPYVDDLASRFFTRNFVLAHGDGTASGLQRESAP